MFKVINANGSEVVCGLEWMPSESINDAGNEVKAEIAKRKQLSRDDENVVLLSNSYVVCGTPASTSAVGIAVYHKGITPPKKSVSLAALCAMYAQGKKADDSLFVWEIEEDVFALVAIKNGLPFYDRVLSKNELSEEVGSLLQIYESGCSVFGDSSVLPPPVADLSIDELVANKSVSCQFKKTGSIVPLIVMASVLSVAVMGGWMWHQQQKEEAARLAAAQQPVVTPEQAFAELQSSALSAIPGCMDISEPMSVIARLRNTVRTYQATEILADCTTGAVSASYQSTIPADLQVRKEDNRLMLSESLSKADLQDTFKIAAQKIDVAKLIEWQDWLVKHGTEKQRISPVGVNVTFGSPLPVVTSPAPHGVKVAIKGNLSMSGQAFYVVDAAKRFENVVWKKVAIAHKDGKYFFNLNGEYYAFKN